jgi:hypothetical protein
MDEVIFKPVYRLHEFCQLFSIGRSTAQHEIKAGRLRVYKLGRATMVTGEEARAWRDWHRANGAVDPDARPRVGRPPIAKRLGRAPAVAPAGPLRPPMRAPPRQEKARPRLLPGAGSSGSANDQNAMHVPCLAAGRKAPRASPPGVRPANPDRDHRERVRHLHRLVAGGGP